MMNCSQHLTEFMEDVKSGKIKACKEIKALIDHVEYCFENEDIYADEVQLEKYISLARYFPFETIFPWQKFVIGLHDCVYWKESGMPRWPDLLCMLGRGAGKDGTIALESVALSSPYNGIPEYDVDICANNEEQALRPAFDIINAFEMPKNIKKLKKFFYWTKEKIVSLKTNSTIKGRTNNPKGKDGLRSGIVIFNEIHQYEDYKNINVFTTGLGKKKHPRRSYYTTQGDVREGPLDNLLEEAEGILFGGDPDNGFLPFICRLDSKDEVHDESNWEKANPSLPYLPDLKEEMRKEYREWAKNPQHLPAFMTKRMNLPDGALEIKVTDWENIAATNKIIPVLHRWSCTCGIDYMKVTDFASVNLHFRKGDERFDINHSWLCLHSKDIPRMKCPWKEWAEEGKLTLVDDVEIHPTVITEYIREAKKDYDIKMLALDDFRFALLSRYLRDIGFDPKIYKNMKLVRPSDIMKVVPVIDSCFVNQWFNWDDNPVLRWAVNNTKLIRSGRRLGADDADVGNFVYGKIEAKSRKTDPFLALVASMTIEDALPAAPRLAVPKMGVYTY
ncbi:MAG: terminase TerL endonuclease subunit [Lachnospiraceae bacterium]|uniref:terminase TerL endonuclease subunit n=1 Tax=Parablautia sp. Marseille-Q6255 TaxID=3039593 RepID=UPI0024BC60AF|nr:terminase TerL endonuclease subunit [Parablautia sp. Marseille-Q6255]